MGAGRGCWRQDVLPGIKFYVKSDGAQGKGELEDASFRVVRGLMAANWAEPSSGHKPMTFEDLDDWEGLNFDLIHSLAVAGRRTRRIWNLPPAPRGRPDVRK